MTLDRANQPDLLNLVLRRAELLASRDATLPLTSAAAAAADQSDELAAVTAELKIRLESAPMAVRWLTLGEPGDLCDRLTLAEAIHPFASSTPAERQADIADRFAADRRCFVLEHPLLLGHPLNVVWVALLSDRPAAMTQILNPNRTQLDPSGASSAVFYSIWNVEPGLSGIPGGASLLTGAMDLLKSEFPRLNQFVTLSPIPGYRAWLSPEQAESHSPEELLKDCARYLCSLGETGRPIDPVARFHLGNGARLVQINPQADLSDRGTERSFGIMANYLYEPEDRPANQAAVRQGNIPIGAQVQELLG